MNHVTVEGNGEEVIAEIGAGCQIKRVLHELNRQGGYMLNSLGLITEQTIAGAISTSTHGSGRPSTSHFVMAARLAHFDSETGAPKITVIDEGDDLRAARCSLGSLGIVTFVRVAIRKQYFVEEHFRHYTTVEAVLAKETEFDLQQFFLMPWSWDFYAQHRREVPGPRSKLAWLYRTYWHLGLDIGLHLAVWPLAKILPRFCTPIFFRHIVPFTLPRGWKVIDRADRQLTMEHELFRHIEIELFVTRSKLKGALDFVTWFLKIMGGEFLDPPPGLIDVPPEIVGLQKELLHLRGAYQHHYPICVRRVQPDDALISMSSGEAEDSYAISFISYVWPSQREGFFEMSNLLTKFMVKLFSARAHWGKHCPEDHTTMPNQYPRWTEFASIRQRFDPAGAFSNQWSRRLFESADYKSDQ
jgi:L-gulono-1,4-lactone dehydrogenase